MGFDVRGRGLSRYSKWGDVQKVIYGDVWGSQDRCTCMAFAAASAEILQ